MTRFEQCKARALKRADELIVAIKDRAVSPSAFESLMESYLRQPAFDETFRERLLDVCLTRFDERMRN